MSKDNQGAIFIASFSEQLIREKVMMEKLNEATYILTKRDWNDWHKALGEYNAHLASRRTFPYPVKEEQDGKELREGKDFKFDCLDIANEAGDSSSEIIAIPIEPKTKTKNMDKPKREDYKSQYQFACDLQDYEASQKHSPIEPDTPLQPVKESAMGWLKKEGYPNVMPMTLDNLGIILDRYTKYLSSPPEPSSNQSEDLQDQVREHIKDDKLFNWHEALTEEEMGYLENLLLTFCPIFKPGSIGYEKQKLSEGKEQEGLISMYDRGMSEYYMQHNYREMYALWQKFKDELKNKNL